jgi:hypothetical protein
LRESDRGMMPKGPLEAYQEAKRTLPLGHYGRAAAKARLDREYAESRVVEAKMWDKYRRHIRRNDWRRLDLQVACDLVYRICDAIGTRAPYKIVMQDRTVSDGAGGEYRPPQKSINLPYLTVDTTTLLHELAHHITWVELNSLGHGSSFLWALEIVWDTMGELREALRQEAA